MIHYLDSSAIVKNYIDEPGSEWMRELFDNSQRGAIFVCEISGAEVYAAFHIRFRTGDISQDALQNACELFQNDFEDFFTCLSVEKHIIAAAMQLIQNYPLRGYDAVPLAAAVSFLNELRKLDGEFLSFVSSDRVLNDAGRNEGLTVIDPTKQT